MVGVTECGGSCTLTLTLPGSMQQHIFAPHSLTILGFGQLCSSSRPEEGKSSSASPHQSAFDGQELSKSLIAKPVTAISRRESRDGQPVKLPDLRNPRPLSGCPFESWSCVCKHGRTKVNSKDTRHPLCICGHGADSLRPLILSIHWIDSRPRFLQVQSVKAARTWQIEFRTRPLT